MQDGSATADDHEGIQLDDEAGEQRSSVSRRRFLTYVAATPLLTVGAKLLPGGTPRAQAATVPLLSSALGSAVEAVEGVVTTSAVPSLPSVEELFDIGDALQVTSLPTIPLVELTIGEDGRATLDIPRIEMGQGITTSLAMLVAEELDLPLEHVDVTLAEGRPELLFNQMTAGSSTLRIYHEPLSVLAATARLRLLTAAGTRWQLPVDALRTDRGAVVAPDGRAVPYGVLSSSAATLRLADSPDPATPKPAGERRIVGTPRGRIDALDIVTGRKKFAMDLDVPGALPTMLRRPPTIKGRVGEVRNEEVVASMPGVVGVVRLPTGVAVAAETFEQARAGAAALDVEFGPGPIDGENNESMLRRLRAAVPPFTVPATGALQLGETVEMEITWAPLYHASLETETAVADVRPDGAELWGPFQTPIFARQAVAMELGLSVDRVRAYVTPAGGAFGRKVHIDGVREAAQVSKALGRPIKLMWPRIDDVRHARVRPPEVSRFRANVVGGRVLSFEQRVCGAEVDYRHGLGEILTAAATELPESERLALGNLAFGAVVFATMVASPYNFGAYTKLKSEIPMGTWTASYRSVPCQPARASEEIMVDELAERIGKDPVEFRREVLKSSRARAVLDAVVEAGQWGRTLPEGVGQGVAVHRESKSYVAVLAEVDARDPRRPRVTRTRLAVDVGRVINPLGLRSQMEGCIVDGISVTLGAGLHIEGGRILESSYADYRFARLRDVPEDTDIIVMPDNGSPLGGAGEVGFAAASGAIANAYARATGTRPRSYPINAEIDFEPIPAGVLPPPAY